MIDILTHDELCELSGYKKATLIIRWLKANKIPFLVARTGWPRVHRDALAEAMSTVKTRGKGKANQSLNQNNEAITPQFDKIR